MAQFRYDFSYDYDRRGVSTNWAFGLDDPLGSEPIADDIIGAVPGLMFRVYCDDAETLTINTERALTAGEKTTVDGLVSTIQDAG